MTANERGAFSIMYDLLLSFYTLMLLNHSISFKPLHKEKVLLT